MHFLQNDQPLVLYSDNAFFKIDREIGNWTRAGTRDPEGDTLRKKIWLAI